MPGRDNDLIELQEAYANAYNQIVEPDKVFVATQYFRTRWVPLLGGPLAWLILALRQHCYWNRGTGEKRDWCLVTQEELAQEIGVSVRTVERLLEHEHAARFIIAVTKRYRYDKGLAKQVRRKSRYRIRMDDPLVPEDEERLKDLLAQQLSGLNVNPETGQLDLFQVLDRLTEAGGDDLDLGVNAASEGEKRPGDRAGMSDAATELAGWMSGILTRRDGTGDEAGEPTAESETGPLYPGAVPVSADELRSFDLGEDQVLVEGPVLSEVEGDEGFLAVPIIEVIKRDIRISGGYAGHRGTDCYYSVAHALGEGPEEWLPEERARISRMAGLERELGECYRRLGAFTLEEALQQYFSPQFTAEIVEGRSAAELERIEGWVAYTRRARGLKNPAGFLRTRIEGHEAPPS